MPNYMYVSLQDDDKVLVFGLDPGSGRLTQKAEVTVIGAPSASGISPDQRVLFVPKDKKRALLDELLNDKDMERVLIFTRTKHGANRVARHLHDRGINSDAIHGNKAQNARQRALDGFRSGRIRALVAAEKTRRPCGTSCGRSLRTVAGRHMPPLTSAA